MRISYAFLGIRLECAQCHKHPFDRWTQEGPVKPEDVAVSFYRALGIDPTQEYHTATGRPIEIVRGGKVIEELFA